MVAQFFALLVAGMFFCLIRKFKKGFFNQHRFANNGF